MQPDEHWRPACAVLAAARLRAPRQRGFTLIEVTVLIIIIAVLSSVMVPAWTRFQERTRFDLDVENVAGLLRWSRETARATSADVVVHFDSQTETFAATPQAPGPDTDVPAAFSNGQDAAPVVAPRSYGLQEDAAVVGLRVNEVETGGPPAGGLGGRAASGSEFVFHEDGSADQVRLELASRQGRRMAIEIYPATGRAAVVEAEP